MKTVKQVISIVAAGLGFIIVIAILLNSVMGLLPGMAKNEFVEVEEKIPDIISNASHPELQAHISAFSRGASRTRRDSISPPVPPIPVNTKLIQGTISNVDYDRKTSLAVIQSHQGKYWLDRQKLYLYSEKTDKLEEITDQLKGMTGFDQKRIGLSFVFPGEDAEDAFLLMDVWVKDKNGYYLQWANELWTYKIQNKDLRRLSIGQLKDVSDVSPDRSMVVFRKSSKENFLKQGGGFHCLYLWDIKNGHIEPFISMWETDPGSGMGWRCRWSADSKAINIAGNCGGFHRGGRRKYTELNLIYMVGEKKMYSIDGVSGKGRER